MEKGKWGREGKGGGLKVGVYVFLSPLHHFLLDFFLFFCCCLRKSNGKDLGVFCFSSFWLTWLLGSMEI